MTYEHSTWWCDCGGEMVPDYAQCTAARIVLRCVRSMKGDCPPSSFGGDGRLVFTSNRALGLDPDGRVFKSGCGGDD